MAKVASHTFTGQSVSIDRKSQAQGCIDLF